MATEHRIAEAMTMESEGAKRGIACELLGPIPNKFYSEEPMKSLGMQDLPAEITELLIKAEDAQSSSDFAESARADRKDINRASEGGKFLESSSEAVIVKAEDNNQLERAGSLETDERTTDEEKHLQQEKSDRDYGTDDVTSAVSSVEKTVEANFNIIEEQRTEEILDRNVDTGCGPKVDRTDNVADMDPTFVSQNVRENILDVESNVSEKPLDLPADQKVPQSLDICKQSEDEMVEIDKIIQNGARDASIAAVAASSDTPNEDTEFTITSDEGDKNPDESSTIVTADMSMKHDEVDTVELKETTSTEGQDMTGLSAEMKHVMPAGENEEYKRNSTESAVITEPVAHSRHQIDEEGARHMDVEEANDLTQETIIRAVQNTLAQEEDGMDRKENLDSSSARHVESMQRDYSNLFSTDASEGERNDSRYLTGEVVTDVSGQELTDAEDHIAKEISQVNAESEGSFLQQSLQGNEQPAINTEVFPEAVSCIKEEAHSKSCEGGSTQKVAEDKSVDNWPNDEEIQENSPLNPEGDQQRSEAADLEVECENITGEWEARNPKETENEDGSEACKSTEFQDAGHPSREGHDPEDVATDIAASGDIHCTGSVADEIHQPTSEPEIVLETAPTSRDEHNSCCGEKKKATEVDEHEELKAKSCNTTDLTDETIRTSPSENSDTTQKENECEIKTSEEPEPAGADRSLEDDTPQGNESSKMSLQISPPVHGAMTQKVEGKEKGTTVVNLADNSSITGLDMVIKAASTPEKDSEETVTKKEGAGEFERSLDEIPEPTEADSPQMGGNILCHEELSAKGNDEDNIKYEQNEINKIYEQTGRSSTTEGQEDPILLNDNKETGESTGPDLIEEDPIQERTTEATAHKEDDVMGCQINPSTEEAVDYTKNITEETNAARDFEVLAEGISEGRPSKDDREEENNEEVHTQLVTFTSCKKTDDHEREEDAKSKFSPSVDEQEIENQKSKSVIDAIPLKEEDEDAKVFTEQVEEAHSVDNTANTEEENMKACSMIQSTSIDECSEKETPPMEHDEYYQSGPPCAPPETNPEVIGAAERFEVPSANGSQAARASAIEDGVPANDNESEAKNHAGSNDTASGVDELPTSAKQEGRLENTDSNVKEDDLTDSGQEKGEIPATVDAIKESMECEILDKEHKDSKDLGTTEKPAVDTLQESLCSILKTEAGEEEREASAEYEGPDKNEDHLCGTHSTEGVLMPQEDESTKIVSESEEIETAEGSAQKEVSEDLHVPPEVPFAVLNIAESTYISATKATEETENQIQVDQHNTISDERSENTHLEMKEIEGETPDEDLKHQESFAPETDIKSRTPEEKVSTENEEDDLKEDYVPDKAAFHAEVSTTIGEENSPLNPGGDQQRSEAAELEIKYEKFTGEWEACNPKETKTEDGSEACKSTEFQDAGHPSREGHDPEDVATDIAASGDIHCTGSVTDEIHQPTSEPEIVLETALTSRAEHDSCCGEKEKATEEDEHEEVKAKSCNTADLTDENIRTSPAENSDTAQKENECEIKSSEESEPAGTDRTVEDDTPQGNESSKISLQISPPMHGEMTHEVEGKEKGTTVVILADNSRITGLDKVMEEALTPEKDSEEKANKNVGADEYKRSLDEIPEPTKADSPQMGGTILCHEELSAKGNDEDNVKYERNEINKIYEQMERSSTTEGPEDLILLEDNNETGECTGPDSIEDDPIQERTTETTARREDNVMVCQINPSTEEAVDYTKNIKEETNAAREFEVLAEGISEGRTSKDDREEENNDEVHMQLVAFTSCKKTDDCEREEDAKSKFSPAVDEQETENQKSKSVSDAIPLKEEDEDVKVFTEQVEEAHSVDNTANTEEENMKACSTIQSTSIDECSEKETLPREHDEYYQSGPPCAPPETNPEVIGAAERFEVPSANGSQAAQAPAIEDGVPANDNESEAKNHAGSNDTASGVDELPTSAKQEGRLENIDSNVKEDDLTDSGQEKGEIPATVDAIKESTECEILDKEHKDSKDLGITEKPAVDTLQESLCSILKTEAGEEEREASAEYEGPDKNEDHLCGTHSTEGVLMPQEDESTKIVSESEEIETAEGSAQKEVSEDLHVPPEVPFAVLNIAEGTYISVTKATEETENQIQVDQHNTISDERSENTHLEMKEIEGETPDEDLKHQESFAPETDIKSRTPEEKVSTENEEENLKEDDAPDKAAFHSEVSTTTGEEMGADDTMSTQNLKTIELTEQTETRNTEIEEHSRLGRETCIAGQVEEEVQDQEKEDPIGLVITPMETIKEDTIKEMDSGINRDIAAVEIGQEEVRPQKQQLDERPNMASGICSDMGPPERTESDHSKHGEEVDGTKCCEISINLKPNSSESDSKSTEREITVVENPTITEEEIELPSDKKDETRASDVKESTETKNCSSIENTDAEETEKHEEISERLATCATQNGEAAKDGSTPNQTIPRESTLELLTPASVSLLEEKENGPKTADEKITDDNEEEVEMQLNENLQLSIGTVQTDEACFYKKEPNKDGVFKIDSNDSESEKDTPHGQKDGCIHGEEVLKVETQEKEIKTANPDSPEVGNTTAEVSITTEEASSIISSKSENVHEVPPDVQTNESFTKLEDVDLKDMKVEATTADVEPEQKCEDAIETNDTSQNAITDEVVLQGQLKTEGTQNGEELETGKCDKKLLLESCKIGEMKDFVPVLEDTQAIDQAEQAQAGNADNEEIQISKIETDEESISTSKTADATKDIVKEVVKETTTLDDFNAPTTVAVETAEIGIPPKEASSGVFNKNVHEVMSDVQEYGSSIELEHDEMKDTKVEAVTADVKPEEMCEDAIGANDMSQNVITNEGLPDENKRLEEIQGGEQRENGEGDIKISEKKDYICPIPVEVTGEVDQDEQAQAGNADKEQIYDKLKDSMSFSKTEDSLKDYDEIIKKTDTLHELNATTVAAVETADGISIPREEASGDMFQKGEHMHEVMSDVQTNESSVGPEDAEMNAMKVEAVTADLEPAEKCEDGIEEIDMLQNAITNEGMTDAHMKAPLLNSCTISEKKDFGKALAEVTEATGQFELEKAGHADNKEIQTSESMIHDRTKDCFSVSKIEDATKDVEKENITGAGTADESNATTLIAVPQTSEIAIPTEEASGFVLSKSENTHEVVLDVQANESSMESEDAETKGMQVEEVMANVKPEENRKDASEANDMSQNAITSEGVLDSQTKEGGEENETGDGDNASLLGSCKINEKKNFGPVVAEDTEATDQVEEAESENADSEEIQTSKSKTDDKPEDSVIVCKTADAIKDVGKKIIQEVDTPDEFNATTIAAVETGITMREPQAEETPVGTSTVPTDSLTVRNSNADDFERIGMVSEISHDSNSAHDETIDGAEITSLNEKLGSVENESEPDGTAHQVTVSKTDQGKTVFSEETIADQTLSAKKLESLVQTPVFASLPGGGEENIEKVENIEGHDKVAGEMGLKENLELSIPDERTDTECLERAEPRNPGVTELDISADESIQDSNEDEKEQNTHGEALKSAPEEKEKETEFADSPLRSIKDRELSGPYEKASDVMFETSKTAHVDMSEVQTVETSEESEGGEIQDVNLEAVAISKHAEQNEDAITAENVEQEMQNEQEKAEADGSEEINEQETMKDVDSKETHGTTPGNSIINQDMHTGSVSGGEITHCDDQTNAEKLASTSESYATVALEENILNGGGTYIAQTKDAVEDFDVTKEIKEEAGSCNDKTDSDTAAMTSLRTETMLAILQDDKPLEASPADLEGPPPEATEPGLILSSKNIGKENLDETSSTSVCQLSDREKENATTQNPHETESRTNVAGENDSSLFLVEKGDEAATTDENIREKSLDGEKAQINENIILTDVTEVCCKKADSITHADTEFKIQANQVTKDTSCEKDKDGGDLVENVKLELPEEESERRSESSASADQGNLGTLAKAAADDLEPEKHCDIATEAADTLRDEILQEEVFIGPGEADEHENLMKEHQVEENCNPNETVAVSPGNRAICEEADSNAVSKEHLEASYSTKKTKGGSLDVEEMSNSKCDAQIQEVLHQGKTQEENRGSVAPTEHANKDSEKLKEPNNSYDKVDTAPKTSSTSIPSSCMAPEEEKPVDDSGTGFDKELPKEVEIETSLLKEKFETQLEDKHLATEDENVGRENVTAESLKADGLGKMTIACEAALGSKDPGMDVIDAMEETTAEELDVSESRSHCLELVHEADATSDQNTSAKALEVQIQMPVSALLQEEHTDERKRDIQNVQETETLLFSSAAEAKEEICQKENGQFEPPKVHPRGSEIVQDLTEKYNECCSTQDEGLEPETQNETKCTDFPSDSEKLVDITSATLSHEQGVCDDLVKSASQVKIQEDFNELEDTGAEENQVQALARDLRAGEIGEETSKANESSQSENAEGQIVEQIKDIDSRPINQEITKGSCEEDELHREKFVEGKTQHTFHSKANELQYQEQEDESKHSAVDEDAAPEEFDKVHVERERADKNSIDEAEGNVTLEGATESEDQNDKTNSGSGTTDATICNKESCVEKSRKGDDLGLDEAKETDPVLERIEYASVAMPEMPVSGEACLSTAPDVKITEGNEDRSPTVKESIVETIQNSDAKNVELGDPSKADLELKGIEHRGERSCSSDEKTSEEDMPKDPSLVSLSDLLDKIPEGNSTTAQPSSKERRPIDEPDAVPPEEAKIDEERDEHEEDEHERTEAGHDAPVIVEPCKDIDVKAPHKKSHNILSGVSSKVKHSISKVKKAITGKSSHSKAHSPK